MTSLGASSWRQKTIPRNIDGFSIVSKLVADTDEGLLMKRLFQSLSRTNDGAFVVDARHRIIFWNQAAETIMGHMAEEVIGLQCYEIIGGQDEQGRTLCQRFCRVAIQVENGDILPNHDVFVRTRTGEGRWLNVTTFAYSSAKESSSKVIVHLFRDVTEIKGYKRFANSVLVASEQLQQNGSYQSLSSAPIEPHVGDLTVRESQVLELLVQGLGTSDIAGSLIISPSTVRNHVQNILGKLGVHSRPEAIAYAYQHSLIETTKQLDCLSAKHW
jgi:PAS domain S-box-containing protein